VVIDVDVDDDDAAAENNNQYSLFLLSMFLLAVPLNA
jgi:hypothetical protein